MNREFDFLVVGGGVVGAAIGYGLARAGQRTVVVDGSDDALRASRTNFGLVWVQGKGDGYTPYRRLTRDSADRWPAFARELEDLTGSSLEYRRNGGLSFCLSDAEADEERQIGERMRAADPDYRFELVDRVRLERMLPNIRLGPKVCAACFSEMDGDVNPLLLLRGLLDGFVRSGGRLVTGESVVDITAADDGFRVRTSERLLTAGRVVIAAGNDTTAFVEPLDLPVRLEAERGQLLVTERVAPVLAIAASGIRQTASGTFQIGGTNERVGRSVAVTSSGARSVAQRAIEVMPGLGSLRVVRHWAGLRVLSPDGYPIYDRSSRHPGIHVAVCHSGVTLAAHHAGPLAHWLAGGGTDDTYAAFRGSRFRTECAA